MDSNNTNEASYALQYFYGINTTTTNVPERFTNESSRIKDVQKFLEENPISFSVFTPEIILATTTRKTEGGWYAYSSKSGSKIGDILKKQLETFVQDGLERNYSGDTQTVQDIKQLLKDKKKSHVYNEILEVVNNINNTWFNKLGQNFKKSELNKFVHRKGLIAILFLYLYTLSSNEGTITFNVTDVCDDIIQPELLKNLYDTKEARFSLDARQTLTVQRFTKFNRDGDNKIIDKACFLFHGVGTGKTITSLSIMLTHLTEKHKKKETPLIVLILAPEAIFKGAFLDDDARMIGLYAYDFNIEYIDTEKKFFIETAKGAVKIKEDQYYINFIGYDYNALCSQQGGLDNERLKELCDFQNENRTQRVLLCDESHRLLLNDKEKNLYANRNNNNNNDSRQYVTRNIVTKAKNTILRKGSAENIISDYYFWKLCNNFNQCVFLTGTPVQTSLDNLIDICSFLNAVEMKNEKEITLNQSGKEIYGKVHAIHYDMGYTNVENRQLFKPMERIDTETFIDHAKQGYITVDWIFRSISSYIKDDDENSQIIRHVQFNAARRVFYHLLVICLFFFQAFFCLGGTDALIIILILPGIFQFITTIFSIVSGGATLGGGENIQTQIKSAIKNFIEELSKIEQDGKKILKNHPFVPVIVEKCVNIMIVVYKFEENPDLKDIDKVDKLISSLKSSVRVYVKIQIKNMLNKNNTIGQKERDNYTYILNNFDYLFDKQFAGYNDFLYFTYLSQEGITDEKFHQDLIQLQILREKEVDSQKETKEETKEETKTVTPSKELKTEPPVSRRFDVEPLINTADTTANQQMVPVSLGGRRKLQLGKRTIQVGGNIDLIERMLLFLRKYVENIVDYYTYIGVRDALGITIPNFETISMSEIIKFISSLFVGIMKIIKSPIDAMIKFKEISIQILINFHQLTSFILDKIKSLEYFNGSSLLWLIDKCRAWSLMTRIRKFLQIEDEGIFLLTSPDMVSTARMRFLPSTIHFALSNILSVLRNLISFTIKKAFEYYYSFDTKLLIYLTKNYVSLYNYDYNHTAIPDPTNNEITFPYTRLIKDIEFSTKGTTNAFPRKHVMNFYTPFNDGECASTYKFMKIDEEIFIMFGLLNMIYKLKNLKEEESKKKPVDNKLIISITSLIREFTQKLSKLTENSKSASKTDKIQNLQRSFINNVGCGLIPTNDASSISETINSSSSSNIFDAINGVKDTFLSFEISSIEEIKKLTDGAHFSESKYTPKNIYTEVLQETEVNVNRMILNRNSFQFPILTDDLSARKYDEFKNQKLDDIESNKFIEITETQYNSILDNIPSSKEEIKNLSTISEESSQYRFNTMLILLKYIRSGVIYKNGNLFLHPHYYTESINNDSLKYYLPVVYPTTDVIMNGFCKFLDEQKFKYIHMSGEPAEIQKALRNGRYKTFPIQKFDDENNNENPICIIIKPEHTEGFSFVYNPAFFAPALCNTPGDQEQAYGRILRKYNTRSKRDTPMQKRIFQYLVEGKEQNHKYDKMVYQFFGMLKKDSKNIQQIIDIYYNKANDEITSRYILHSLFSDKNATIYSKKGWLDGSREKNMGLREGWKLFDIDLSTYLPDFNSEITKIWTDAELNKTSLADQEPENQVEIEKRKYINEQLQEQSIIPFASDENHLEYLYKTSLLTENYFKTLIKYEKEIQQSSEINVIPMDIVLLDKEDKEDGSMCAKPNDREEDNFGYLCYETNKGNNTLKIEDVDGGRKTKRNRKKQTKNKNKKQNIRKTKRRRGKK